MHAAETILLLVITLINVVTAIVVLVNNVNIFVIKMSTEVMKKALCDFEKRIAAGKASEEKNHE